MNLSDLALTIIGAAHIIFGIVAYRDLQKRPFTSDERMRWLTVTMFIPLGGIAYHNIVVRQNSPPK